MNKAFSFSFTPLEVQRWSTRSIFGVINDSFGLYIHAYDRFNYIVVVNYVMYIYTVIVYCAGKLYHRIKYTE